MAAVAALVLVLSMGLPWYQKSFDPARARASSSRDSLNAFGVFTFVEAAILLVAGGVLFLIWARMEGKGFHLPGGDGLVISLAGGWAVLLLIWRVFDRPGDDGAERRGRDPVGLHRRARRRGGAGRRRARACAPPTAPSRRTRPRTSTGRPPPRRPRRRASDRREPRDATAVTEVLPRPPGLGRRAARGRPARSRRRGDPDPGPTRPPTASSERRVFLGLRPRTAPTRGATAGLAVRLVACASPSPSSPCCCSPRAPRRPRGPGRPRPRRTRSSTARR